jgi:uncharacterized protein YjiS (DUF1127 family)
MIWPEIYCFLSTSESGRKQVMKSAIAIQAAHHASPKPIAVAARLWKEYLEYRRVRQELTDLPAGQLRDIGVSELEFRHAMSGFRAWRRSRFGRSLKGHDE